MSKAYSESSGASSSWKTPPKLLPPGLANVDARIQKKQKMRSVGFVFMVRSFLIDDLPVTG